MPPPLPIFFPKLLTSFDSLDTENKIHGMNAPRPSLALINALGLSPKEKAVLDALLSFQMARNVSVIARQASLPRTTTLYILRKFEKRKLARRSATEKRVKWIYHRITNHIDKNL
jgi:DNA-binding MarR family transcriptional regulator